MNLSVLAFFSRHGLLFLRLVSTSGLLKKHLLANGRLPFIVLETALVFINIK